MSPLPRGPYHQTGPGRASTSQTAVSLSGVSADDDLTGTVFAGHHQPLRVWVAGLYLMGLNLSNRQSAHELGINEDDAQGLIRRLRQGVAAAPPPLNCLARSRLMRCTWLLGTRASMPKYKKGACRSASTA